MNPTPDWQEILRAAHNEPIDPAHYTAVRARVLAEIERTRKPWRRLAWLSGVAAAVLALLAVPIPRPALPNLALPPRPQPVAQAWVIPPKSAPAAPAKPAALSAVKHEPLTIKLQTDDPNIVIYWIAD